MMARPGSSRRATTIRAIPSTRPIPLGRQQTVTYAANGIDVLQVRRTSNGLNDLLSSFSNYTSGHRPQTATDAAGQVTASTYNARGLVVTTTNAKNETTTLAYDGEGRPPSAAAPPAWFQSPSIYLSGLGYPPPGCARPESSGPVR